MASGEELPLRLDDFPEQMGSEGKENGKRLHIPFREAVPGKSSLGISMKF